MSIQDDSMVAVATPEAPPLPVDVAPPGPPPKPRRRRLPLLLVALGVLAIILVGGAVAANAALSQTYSASQAVQDYYDAMARGNADGMLANATFIRGDGSYSYFFGKPALQGMLALPANRNIRNVKLTGDRQIDGSSHAITVSMSWNGTNRSQTLTVRKDPADVHWLFYPSWRVEIPASRIQVTLPNQPGIISLDGIPGSSENQTAIQAVPGFHRVSMAATDFYDPSSADTDAVDSPATVSLTGTIRASAIQAAQTAIKAGFNSCDAAKYDACFNHTYPAPDRNFIYYFKLPGYGNINYTRYLYSLRGDPTAGMKLTIGADAGKVTVSGTCAATITVDGSRKYQVNGDYTGTLTWGGGDFGSDLTWQCDKAKG
jgi:hypothetical protein